MAQNKQKWIKKRHMVVRNLAALVLGPYSRLVYRIKIDKFKQENGRQYLVVMNHQTAFDQFFVSLSFKQHIYYVASEDLFSKGFLSDIIRFIVAPIPFKKSVADIKGVRDCLRVAKEGGTIALSPEGNRTYGGRTGYIKPSIASLVKALKLPLAIYRIEGGFGAHPRWSDVIRKGKMRGYVKRVIEFEEYKDLSDEALFSLIKEELFVDEAVVDVPFVHKKSAEYLERAMYICPFCGLAEFYSEGDTFTCKKCGKQAKYLPTKQIKGVNCKFPFEFLADWYDWQCDEVRKIDLEKYIDKPLYTDTVSFSRVRTYKDKERLARVATLSLYGDRYKVEYDNKTFEYPFEKITAATVLGKNKLNFYIDKELYQIKADKRFNGLKYLNIYCLADSRRKGEEYAEFLGL